MIWNSGQQGRQNSCVNEASIILRKAENRGTDRIIPGVFICSKGNYNRKRGERV